MRKLIVLLATLLVPTISHAEHWICYESKTVGAVTYNDISRYITGDCLTLGLCSGFDNTGLQSQCFEAVNNEFDLVSLANKKVDPLAAAGSRIVDLTQAELDAIAAAEAQAIANAKATTISTLDNKVDGVKLNDMTLTKVDAKIDAINNLADAKAFLKLLVRAIVKLEGGL